MIISGMAMKAKSINTAYGAMGTRWNEIDTTMDGMGTINSNVRRKT